MGKKEADDAAATPAQPQYAFFAKTKEECFAKLELGDGYEKVGLSSQDAAARLEKYGPNSLTEKEKKTIWQRIWHHIANVLVAILVFVAIVSLVRAVTSTTVDNIVSNALQVALIVFVITYVSSTYSPWALLLPVFQPFVSLTPMAAIVFVGCASVSTRLSVSFRKGRLKRRPMRSRRC